VRCLHDWLPNGICLIRQSSTFNALGAKTDRSVFPLIQSHDRLRITETMRASLATTKLIFHLSASPVKTENV
jgi:hypothetical protein